MKSVLGVFLSLLLLFTAGCSDDDDCVQCPADLFPNPTIENIWPNADQRTWTYTYQSREWEGEVTVYLTPEDVPDVPLPSWTEVFNLVQARTPVTPFVPAETEYRLRFDGMTTTGPGVTAQNLVDELLLIGSASGTATRRQPLLDLILHPQSRLENLAARQSTQEPPWPLLLHGGAWEKTASHLGMYGELDTNLAWLFLTSNLSPGSEFSLPLVPSVADDAMLYGRVHRRVAVETEIGTFAKALDCLYIIYFGVAEMRDTGGQLLGYVRTFDYGRVIYAPTIGPVYSYEKWGVEPGNPPSSGFGDIELELIHLSVGPR